MEDGYFTDDRDLQMLQEALDEYGLKVAGITPISQRSGCEARPLEIREWLNTFTCVFSYVILDDDTFWNWGWLQRNVVTTHTYVDGGDEYYPYVKGLTMKLADKAIRILNERGAYISYV